MLRLALSLAAATFLSSTALAADRALVIGNNDYPNLPEEGQLRKAVGDAERMSATLSALGYEVTMGENLDRSGMIETIDAFGRSLEPGDRAFVFFAGHGIAVDGANYLLPSDAPGTTDETGLLLSSVAEADIETMLSRAGVTSGVLVLDACRNNPFSTASGEPIGPARGLARSEPPNGIFKLYSAGIGQAALDDLGPGDDNPNSVFTRTLASEIVEPGQSLIELAYEVKAEVAALAETVDHDQRPAHFDGGFANRIYLGAEAASCEAASDDFARAHERGTAEAFAEHAESFPACPYAPAARVLTARLGGEIDGADTELVSLGTPATRNPASLATAPLSERRGLTDTAASIACDRLAADRFDPTKPSNIPGVGFGDIDAARALAACSLAVRSNPESVRTQFQYARALDAAGSIKDAVPAYRDAAERGHPNAANNLATFYDQGQGVELDIAEANRWYRAAAEKGIAIAQANLAFAYQTGRGFEADPAEAVRWYREAAEGGDKFAPLKLAQMIEAGEGTAKDMPEALKWYRVAGENENAEALYAAGRILALGAEGVPADPDEGAVMMIRAANLGHQLAKIIVEQNG